MYLYIYYNNRSEKQNIYRYIKKLKNQKWSVKY